jgi:hypothetical protein
MSVQAKPRKPRTNICTKCLVYEVFSRLVVQKFADWDADHADEALAARV